MKKLVKKIDLNQGLFFYLQKSKKYVIILLCKLN